MVEKPRDIFDAIRRTLSHARKLGLGIDSLHVHPDDLREGIDALPIGPDDVRDQDQVIWGQQVTLDPSVDRGYVFVKVSGVMAANWANDDKLVTLSPSPL